MSAPDFPSGFYVYRLIDPRNGLPFYVGKGQRDRAWHHERAVRSGVLTGSARKNARIQQILAQGKEVEIEILASYVDEADALDHEFRLVDADPTLTNVMPGGIGKAEDPKRYQARLRAQLFAQAKRREERMAAARLLDQERRLSKLVPFKASEQQAAEVEAWHRGLPPDALSNQSIAAKRNLPRREGITLERLNNPAPAPRRVKRRSRGPYGCSNMIQELDELWGERSNSSKP